jgi:hypothetical protein
MSNPDWYVAHTRPRCEKKLADYCGRQGFSVTLPCYRSVRKYRGKTVVFEKPLFPSYVFLKLFRPQRQQVGTALDGRESRTRHDDGPGVPKELRERVFDPFVTTKDVGAGTGLGLAVCRGIVEGAKGRIFVDGTYEGGARFVVELPRG